LHAHAPTLYFLPAFALVLDPRVAGEHGRHDDGQHAGDLEDINLSLSPSICPASLPASQLYLLRPTPLFALSHCKLLDVAAVARTQVRSCSPELKTEFAALRRSKRSQVQQKHTGDRQTGVANFWVDGGQPRGGNVHIPAQHDFFDSRNSPPGTAEEIHIKRYRSSNCASTSTSKRQCWQVIAGSLHRPINLSIPLAKPK